MRILGLYDVRVNHPLPFAKSIEKAGDTLLKKNEVFEKADSYQFDFVQEYLEQGGNAEIYDEYGSSLLTALLDAYYRLVFNKDPDEAQFLAEHDDDDEYHQHVNKYCRMPLEERPHRIKEQIDYLMDKGIGVNAVDWEAATAKNPDDPCVETPLMQTVFHCDYCMAKYLLEKGADPGQKLFSHGSYDEVGYEDWLLEHMDIYLFNGDYGDAGNLDVEMVALLMHYGLDQWSGGYCIDVDKENRMIQGHGPHMKF